MCLQTRVPPRWCGSGRWPPAPAPGPPPLLGAENQVRHRAPEAGTGGQAVLVLPLQRPDINLLEASAGRSDRTAALRKKRRGGDFHEVIHEKKVQDSESSGGLSNEALPECVR